MRRTDSNPRPAAPARSVCGVGADTGGPTPGRTPRAVGRDAAAGYARETIQTAPARHAGNFALTTPTRSTAMKTMETKRTKHISRRFRRFARANEAVSALEYAILVGVIAVGMAAALATFESQIDAALTAIGGTVASTQVSGTPTAASN